MKTVYSYYPASAFGQLWREGFPVGNGLTGAVVYGGAGTETVVFNRYDLWHGAVKCQLPDTSEVLKKMRALAKENKPDEAKDILCDELKKQNYQTEAGWPFPLGTLKIAFPDKQIFSDYKRELNLETGECTVSFADSGIPTERKCFVSRTDDVFVYSFRSEKKKKLVISFDMHNDGMPASENKRKQMNTRAEYDGEYIFYEGTNDDGRHYGAVVKVIGAANTENSLKLCSDKALIIVKCYSGCVTLSRKK